jgi:Leucine-rich repeat (LRR) protein
MDRVSLGNLNSLLELSISSNRVDLELQAKILENCSYIEKLGLTGNLYNFNLDSLIYLRELSLHGRIKEDFNFDIFDETICKKLEKLSIGIENTNIENGNLAKLFKDHHFPNLVDLRIEFSKTDNAEKKLFDKFPNLNTLNIHQGFRLIDADIFSNLKHLVNLEMSNGFIESLNQPFFSKLTKLQSLNICSNGIKCIEENTFSHLKNLHTFQFNYNHLEKLNAKSFVGLDISALLY